MVCWYSAGVGQYNTSNLLHTIYSENGSALYTDATTSTTSPVDLSIATTTGGYEMVKSPFLLNGNICKCDIGVIGVGVFSGNHVGSDNYAIASSDTDFSADDFKSQFPYVSNSMTFAITEFSAADLNNIDNVAFMYGSVPDGVIVGAAGDALTPNTPEPGSISTLCGMCTMGGMFFYRRRAACRKNS